MTDQEAHIKISLHMADRFEDVLKERDRLRGELVASKSYQDELINRIKLLEMSVKNFKAAMVSACSASTGGK